MTAHPRWGPDRYLGERITRVGRWRARDPLQPGRVWGRWEWAGFAFWLLLLTGAFAKAWRDTGGPGALSDRAPKVAPGAPPAP